MNKSALTKVLFSSVFALITPLIVLQGIIYFWSHALLEEDLCATAESNLHYLQTYLERKAQDVYDIADTMLSSGMVGQFHAKLAHGAFASTSNYYTEVKDIQELLKVMRYSNELVKQVSLIFPNSDVMITTSGHGAITENLLAQLDEATLTQDHHLMNIEDVLYCLYSWKNPHGLPSSPMLMLVEIDPLGLENVLSSYSEANEKSSYFVNLTTQQLLSSSGAVPLSAEDVNTLLTGFERDGFRQQIVIDNVKYEVFVSPSEALHFAAIQVVNSMQFTRVPFIIGVMMAGLCLATIFCLINLLGVLRRTVSRPLAGLLSAFQRTGEAKFDLRLPEQNIDEFQQLASGYNAMADHLNHLLDTTYRQTISLQQSKLKELQAQINPHFLYNSLFFLRHLMRTDELESATAFSNYLGQHYEYITRNDRDRIALSEEYKHALNYLHIQLLRYDETVELDTQPIPENMADLLVPRLMLQPVVENCFKYGLNAQEEGGGISIRFAQSGSQVVRIIIENSGTNLSDADLESLQTRMEMPLEDVVTVTGLINTHHRLRLFFGAAAGITLERSELGGLKVCLSITRRPLPPVIEKGDE